MKSWLLTETAFAAGREDLHGIQFPPANPFLDPVVGPTVDLHTTIPFTEAYTPAMFKFQPAHDNIHFKVEKHNKQGNIHLPDDRVETIHIARVVTVGPGWFDPASQKRVPVSVKPGDMILVPAEKTVIATYLGEKVFIVKDSDILGTVTDIAGVTVETPGHTVKDQ